MNDGRSVGGAGCQALEQFHAVLRARGCCALHVNATIRHIRELTQVMEWPPSEPAIVMAVGKVLEKGRSLRTCNAYLRSIKSFVRWCVRAKLIPEDCAKDISPYKQEKDRRHRRTAFTETELARLLEATESSRRVFRGIMGQDRAALYYAAICTGLRLGTLAQLEVGQFHVGPSDSIAFVRVWAEQVKDAEDLIVPIAPYAAEILRRYLSNKRPPDKAFKVPKFTTDASKMLRADEVEAGIVYCQRTQLMNGRVRRTQVLDFHAFRYTFGTRCARAGVPLPTVQRWMGHSDPKLTANIYNQVQLADAPASLSLMPRIQWGLSG